jgi:DNA-binding NarL/FixJ family response regulator
MNPISRPTEQRADGLVVPIRTSVREFPSRRKPLHPPSQMARTHVRIEHRVPLIRSGINAILAGSGEFELVAAPAYGQARDASHSETDVLIADVDTGLSALESGIACNVLIVAQEDGEVLIRKALAKGVRGFLLHTCAAEELTTAVKTVSLGGTAFAPLVTDRILQSFAFEQLTERELQVLQLIVHGCSNKDIARKLQIAPGTIKSHVKAIFIKLGAARRAEAAAIAQRRGIARLDNL